jgi:dihydropteroate synthase
LSAKVNPFYKKSTLNLQGKLLDLSTPKVMGILNVTPDSFFDGGKYLGEKAILSHAEKMISEGADFLDIGGYSSRPGADNVPEQEELNRVVNAVRIVIREFPETIISVDTFRTEVARAGIQEGARIINDISGGEHDAQMIPFVCETGTPYIIMHMRGNPKTMGKQTDYLDLYQELMDYFLKKLDYLKSKGMVDLIIDPGFGFAKTMEQNYELLKNLNYFEVLEVPILVGVSRKSMFRKLLGTPPEESLNATTAAHMIALKNGASILRVHDVKEAVQAVKVFKITEK